VSGSADRERTMSQAKSQAMSEATGEATRGLVLAVLDPAAEPAGRALAAEARRLATRAGWEVRFVSWRAPGAVDTVSEVAPGVGEAVVSARPFTEDIVSVLAERCAAVAPEGESSLVVLLADTTRGREVAALLAHRLGCGAVLGCSDIRPSTGQPVFVKPVYGGWLERECRPADGDSVVATLDMAGLEETAEAAPLEVEWVEVAASAVGRGGDGQAVGQTARVRRLELLPPDPRTVDLTHAKRVVAVGAGAATDRLLGAVRELADLLAGSLGATRPVVDEGVLPKERLVGQTGKSVGPDLYLALGISGSPHHVAGVQRAGRIISINRDPRAPIFGLGDLGFVADLEGVLPALVEKIKAWREEQKAVTSAEGGDGPA